MGAGIWTHPYVQQTPYQLSHIHSSWVGRILWILSSVWTGVFQALSLLEMKLSLWIEGGMRLVILCWTQCWMSEAQKRRSPSFAWRQSKLIFRKALWIFHELIVYLGIPLLIQGLPVPCHEFVFSESCDDQIEFLGFTFWRQCVGLYRTSWNCISSLFH